MPVITINGKPYKLPPGTKVGELLAGAAETAMPCGGHGRCGKCKVRAWGDLNPLTETEKLFLSEDEIGRGIRLACMTVALGDCGVSAAAETAGAQIRIQGITPKIRLRPSFTSYGCAVDIGTTTLAACLYDTRGHMLARAGSGNPQAGWGADVISRLEAAMKGAGEAMRAAVCGAVDELLLALARDAGISPREIDGIAITGNTVMLYLLTGTDPESLSHAPFSVKRRFGETVEAGGLGLTSVTHDAEVYLPPCIAAFVGADLVTALLASGICDMSGIHMLTDIGTNGETALVREGKLLVCSTAAGPVFEGAGISRGMQGRRGAIDHVSLRDGCLEAHVIGEAEAEGICGSGVVDAVACLLEGGQIDDTGYMEDDPVPVSPTVSITQKDVRMVQLAKSAVHAGIRTLLRLSDTDCREVSGLFLAGGFGSFLDVRNAARIGLIPKELAGKTRAIGNAALSGAAMLLLDRESRALCRTYADTAEKIELASDPFFSEAYMEGMMFPAE